VFVYISLTAFHPFVQFQDQISEINQLKVQNEYHGGQRIINQLFSFKHKTPIRLLKIKNQNKQTCPWLPFPVGGKDYYKMGCDLKLSLWVRYYVICNPLTEFLDIYVKEHKYACNN